MVQFKPIYTHPRPSERDKAEDYWKLDNNTGVQAVDLRRRLDELGIQYNKSSNHAHLSVTMSRVERNLVIYDRCSVAELRKFYAARKQAGAPECGATKAIIIAQLERTDENPVFDRFMDLPPEMRELIFSKHFESLTCQGIPFPPPATRINKQLRQESLPVFFKAMPCKLVFGFVHIGTGSRALCTVFQRRYFAHGPVDRIWKLHLEARMDQQTRGWRVNVELEPEETRKLVKEVRCVRRHHNADQDEEASTLVQGRVDAFLSTLTARGEGLQVQRGDLIALLGLFAWQP